MAQERINELTNNAYNCHFDIMWKSEHQGFKMLAIFSTFSFSRFLYNKCKKEPKIYEKYRTEKKIKKYQKQERTTNPKNTQNWIKCTKNKIYTKNGYSN